MDFTNLFVLFMILWFVIAVLAFFILFKVPAPYGRYTSSRWKFTIASKYGWLIMESPAVFVFAAWFLFGKYTQTYTAILFFVMWETHYLYRSFIYPFTLQEKDKQMPYAILLSAFFFNIINGTINGSYVFTISGGYPNDWFSDMRFILGFSLFAVGLITNILSDRILRNLRAPGETGYKIPTGGLFRWVSCPNYLGEIVEWTGWAIATWSISGLAFAVWTGANLIPRALSHHKWYRNNFPEYPDERKALIPGLW
jgi:protein-S-isoprenylcysteine O-methyltransferase Ste14